MGMGSKSWWSLLKDKQGIIHQDTLPPSLTRPDGTAATHAKENAQVLTRLLAKKIRVNEPEKSPSHLEQQYRESVTKVKVKQAQIEHLLWGWTRRSLPT